MPRTKVTDVTYPPTPPMPPLHTVPPGTIIRFGSYIGIVVNPENTSTRPPVLVYLSGMISQPPFAIPMDQTGERDRTDYTILSSVTLESK